MECRGVGLHAENKERVKRLIDAHSLHPLTTPSTVSQGTECTHVSDTLQQTTLTLKGHLGVPFLMVSSENMPAWQFSIKSALH